MVILIVVLILACIILGAIQIAMIKQINKTIRSINLTKKDLSGQGKVIDLELQMICANANYMKEIREDLITDEKAINKFAKLAITASNHAALVNTELIRMNNKHAKKEGGEQK